MLKQTRSFNHVKNKVYQVNRVIVNSLSQLPSHPRSTVSRGSYRYSSSLSTYYHQTSSPLLIFIPRLFENNLKASNSFKMATSRPDSSSASHSKKGGTSDTPTKPRFSKEELKARLSPIQYQVTQLKGTERPGTGEYNKFNKKGSYHCIVCDQELFKSDTKFESGCGWPAFYDAAEMNRVKFVQDHSLVSATNLLLLAKKADLIRTEVLCSNCDAHLGHRFDDGPISKGGKRFCINSASLKFVPAQDSGSS